MKPILTFLAIIFIATTTLSQSKTPLSNSGAKDLVIPGHIVVKLKPGFNLVKEHTNEPGVIATSDLGIEMEIDKPFKAVEKARVDLKSGIDFTSYYKLKFDPAISVESVISRLQLIEGVEFAEPRYKRLADYTPNDPSIASQYYLEKIKAYEAWDITQGSEEVVVAVVDSGIDYLHEDLDDKVFVNEGEIPDNGIDDDQDGFIDNYYGWDFAGADVETLIADNDPIAKADNIHHGTTVVGCIAAETDNEIGIAGVGFNTKFMAIKCSADNDTSAPGNQAYLYFTAEAVLYAADHGADVINMSYGGSGSSQFVQDIMTYAAVEKGVVLVGSAGNSGIDEPGYPNSYEHVISVAATDENDLKAGFSTFHESVDISAPGVAIFTTYFDSRYSSTQGTSFSSPIVAGAAALLVAHFPQLKPAQIEALLVGSADNIDNINPAYKGKLGAGRLNIEAALTLQQPFFDVLDYRIINGLGTIPLPGEAASISFDITNLLSTSSANTTLKVEPVAGNPVTVNEKTISIGAIETDSLFTLDAFLSFTVPNNVVYNNPLYFLLTIDDPDQGYMEEFPVTFIVNPLTTISKSAPYNLAQGGDFESSPDDFRSAQLTGGIDLWERGQPTGTLETVNSGTNVWKTDLDDVIADGTYSCALQTPVFDLTELADYRISFQKSMEVTYCDAPFAVQVQYSVDGGDAWETLGTLNDPRGVNWYNKDPNADLNGGCAMLTSIFGNQEGFMDDFDNELTEYNVSHFAGNDKVVFRFVLSVLGGLTENGYEDGFMVDDFQLTKSVALADFDVDKKVIFSGNEVNFEYLSNGAVSYLWDFGDGNTSTDQNPSHVFTSSGRFEVSLTVTDILGGTDTKTKTISIIQQRSVPYLISDGGNFEVNTADFQRDSIRGTAFQYGVSIIDGKDGTNSGDYAWVTGIEENLYADNSESYLYTPEFDFSIVGEYIFSFYAKYSFEDNWDGFIVEYSTNKGTSWIKLNDNMVNKWYNQISDPNSVFGASVAIFSGNTVGEFKLFETPVSFLSGGNNEVTFRFKFLSDANTVDAGVAIDDFQLTGPVDGDPAVDFELINYSGCEGQLVTVVNKSVGTITSMSWDFGSNATPSTAVGPGPHEVLYETIGEGEIVMTAETSSGVLQKTLPVITGANHSPIVELDVDSELGIILIASEGDNFIWLNDGDTIPGANSRIYDPQEDGLYSAIVEVGGCYRLSGNVKRVTVGVNEIDHGLTVYPNPLSSNHLMINNSTGSAIQSIIIRDMGGSVVFMKNMNNSLEVDLSELSNGLYVIQINTLDSEITNKLLINR